MREQLSIFPFPSWKPGAFEKLLIAGPCGAESEEQVMSCAKSLAQLNKPAVFRAGIWKPRTRPNSFEGVGERGLVWLTQVQKNFGLLTTVEVANAHHVELALKHKVDLLWVGARTTGNPFSVQEIADALKGTNIPVMIKNPVQADLQLWIGAIERIHQAGITKIIAIHRGFHNGTQVYFRNSPMWEIPIELKTIFPELPIICDPSHIGGKRELIKELAQKALDLNMDGLMIEVHPNPDNALSDAKQQLTPEAYGQLLNELKFRNSISSDRIFNNELLALRNTIDKIDEDLLIALRKRLDVIEQIGRYKKENNVAILQLERWMEILKTRTESGIQKEMDKTFLKNFCQLLHEESIRVQNELMNKTN